MTLRYRQGLTVDQIAQEVGVAPITVSRQLRKAGVEMRSVGPKPMPVGDEKILRLRGEGLTWQEVADRVGMTSSGAYARWRNMRGAHGLADPIPSGQRPSRPRPGRRLRPPRTPLSPLLQRTVDLYLDGMSVHEVGAQLGVSGTTVSRRLRAAEVPGAEARSAAARRWYADPRTSQPRDVLAGSRGRGRYVEERRPLPLSAAACGRLRRSHAAPGLTGSSPVSCSYQ